MPSTIDPAHQANRQALALAIVAEMEHQLPDVTGTVLADRVANDDEFFKACVEATGRTRIPSDATRAMIVTLLGRGGATTAAERADADDDPFAGV